MTISSGSGSSRDVDSALKARCGAYSIQARCDKDVNLRPIYSTCDQVDATVLEAQNESDINNHDSDAASDDSVRAIIAKHTTDFTAR